MYKEYKRQIIKAKNNDNLLKDMLHYLQSDKTTLKRYQKQKLINLIVSLLNINFKGKKANKQSKEVKILQYLEAPINDTYLFSLLEDIDFNGANDYINGLYNLLTDNNYIYNGIGLKIVIAKYLQSLDDIKNLKVFKVSNFKLNNDFKFLVFKNGKTLNYTKLYFNNEYNFIIFNTLQNDNIVSIVLYDETKINDIEVIVQSGVTNYDKTFKHINLNDYKYKYVDKWEQNEDNKEKLEKIFNYKYNTKSVGVKLTYKDIINNFFEDIYFNDLYYSIYTQIKAFEKNKDNFEANDLNLLKSTIEDYDNFNYDNIFKKVKLEDIKINNRSNKQINYKKYVLNKCINNSLKNLQSKEDIKQKDIVYIVNRL